MINHVLCRPNIERAKEPDFYPNRQKSPNALADEFFPYFTISSGLPKKLDTIVAHNILGQFEMIRAQPRRIIRRVNTDFCILRNYDDDQNGAEYSRPPDAHLFG